MTKQEAINFARRHADDMRFSQEQRDAWEKTADRYAAMTESDFLQTSMSQTPWYSGRPRG